MKYFAKTSLVVNVKHGWARIDLDLPQLETMVYELELKTY